MSLVNLECRADLEHNLAQAANRVQDDEYSLLRKHVVVALAWTSPEHRCRRYGVLCGKVTSMVSELRTRLLLGNLGVE